MVTDAFTKRHGEWVSSSIESGAHIRDFRRKGTESVFSEIESRVIDRLRGNHPRSRVARPRGVIGTLAGSARASLGVVISQNKGNLRSRSLSTAQFL